MKRKEAERLIEKMVGAAIADGQLIGSVRKYNENHDELGRFASSDSSGAPEIPDRVSTPRALRQRDQQIANGDYKAPPLANPRSLSEFQEQTELGSLLRDSGAEVMEVQTLDKPLTTDEIIEKVGGWDGTDGSCASVALAYIGNEYGYDVLDYRGGESSEAFQDGHSILDMTRLDGVKSYSSVTEDQIEGAHNLMNKMTAGKEYLLTIGQHAAITIKEGISGEYKFLDLQTDSVKGWYKLDDDALERRFAAAHEVYSNGEKVQTVGFAVDVSTLAASPDFKNILGYLNTATDKQMKGAAYA